MKLREKILGATDIAIESVYVPQWGVTVNVRGLNGRQRSILLQDAVNARGKVDLGKMYPQLIVLSCYDPEDNTPVFTEGDFDAVAEKSGAALEVIAKVAMRLSGLDGEEAEKNLEETQSGDSTSN